MSDRKIQVAVTVNGEDRVFLCEPRQSLLEVLRDELFLTGTKEGCNDGNCGSCNVLLDDTLVNSCCVFGIEVAGCRIDTVEGLADGNNLHPLQQAFLERSGLQCGFCTPGFLVAASALLKVTSNPAEREIRQWFAGNLCRCTGYDKIVKAVQDAAQILREEKL
ncbi:MAG: (2Fe-2S)-binding protein [Arenicellales bacterium]|jgi:carbon-monoxide dehydrogenase small subunit|nr:(2Fe-2S)-binding protein [Arenicellales bacterium]|tara:strand:- start:2716 stop:3204 length:489 start_codon:yes stop_codon:yes gene_type:complete